MRKILFAAILAIAFASVAFGQRQAPERRVVVIVEDRANVGETIMEMFRLQLQNAFREAGYTVVTGSPATRARLDSIRMAFGNVRREHLVGDGELYGVTSLCHVTIRAGDGGSRMISGEQIVVASGVAERERFILNPLNNLTTAENAAREIAGLLLPGTGTVRREERVRQERENTIFHRNSWEERSNYIAWGVANIGHPWTIGTSIAGRHGGIIGFGWYASVGFDMGGRPTYSLAQHGTDGDSFISDFHYAVGLRVFPYQGIFLSAGYGTFGMERTYRFNHANGSFGTEGWRQKRGVTLTLGHDWLFGNDSGTRFFLSPSAGVGYDINTQQWHWRPMLNIRIGMAWGI